MDKLIVDVAIVGGGLSGLVAAYKLMRADQKLRILVLEAKDRIGGRTQTVQLRSADGSIDFWDVGGEWVGRPQVYLQDLLRQFKLDTFTPTASNTYAPVPSEPPLSWKTRVDLKILSWKLTGLKNMVESIESLVDSVSAIQWDAITLENYVKEQVWTEGAIAVVDTACRCMFGLSPNEMSLLYFLMYIEDAGGLNTFIKPTEYSGKDCRVKGGIQQLASNIVYKIGRKNVLLNQPVTHIVQNPERVVVVTSNRLQVLCQRVILAVPPHHAASISFTPPLPSAQLALLESVPLAFLVKFAVTYDEAFWMNDSNNQFGFQRVLLDSEAASVGIVYDATSSGGNPALAGFLSSVSTSENDDSTHKERILYLLEILLGDSVREFVDIALKDWSKEPFNGGCFLKSIIPGTTRYLNQDLRKAFDRVHFAGTETATVWCGFMNGAVQSGYRAASEVLKHLSPNNIGTSKKSVKDADVLIKSITWALFGVGLFSVVFMLMKSTRNNYTPNPVIKLLCER